MEFEIEALHTNISGRGRVYIADARFTPGQRYRVTVTPADAPRPEPAGFVLQYADGSFGETLKERPDQIPLMFGLPEGGGIVPLYEHPPAPVDTNPGASWVPTSRFLENQP